MRRYKAMLASISDCKRFCLKLNDGQSKQERGDFLPEDTKPVEAGAGWRACRLLLDSTHQIGREMAARQDAVCWQ